MKRLTAVLIIGIFLASPACAQDRSDDATAQDFSALRKKIGKMKREMDLLMKEILSDTSAAGSAVVTDFGGDVNVDILQDEKNIIVKADLPGMDKDKINITLERNRYLKIAGSREMVKSINAPGVVKQERFYGRFEKSLELPCEVENRGINATYKEGVLEIVIPKKAQAKKEEVKINIK